jgi:putative nucleic acid binding protein
MRIRNPLLLATAVCALCGACAQHLPDQDLRILETAPAAKTTPDDLWKEFQADRRAAAGRYHGRAVDVSGRISVIVAEPAKQAILFLQKGAGENVGVEARLLDDRASQTTKDTAAGQRITLRCFVEGLETNLILKSCVKP